MTETRTETLAEFLLARIAEDETLARSALTDEVADWWAQDWAEVDDTSRALVDRFDPHRVLAVCAAHRRIVELHAPMGTARVVCAVCWNARFVGHEDWPCPTLLALAQPYADHPDFREEWRLPE